MAAREEWRRKQLHTHPEEEEAGRRQISNELDKDTRKLDNDLQDMYRSREHFGLTMNELGLQG